MPRLFRFEGKTYSLPDGTADQEALDFISAQHPAVPAERPGFFESMGNTLMSLPGAVMHSLTSTPLTEWRDDLNGISPEEWKQSTVAAQQRAGAGPMRPGTKPPADIVPSYGEVLGNMAGQGLGAAGMALLGEGMESPRLRGAAMGVVRAVPQALESGLSHHFIPNPLKMAGTLASGAKQGAQGKLWLGDVARGLRDEILPAPPSEISGRPSVLRPDVSQYGQSPRPQTVPAQPVPFSPAPSPLSVPPAPASAAPAAGPTLPTLEPGQIPVTAHSAPRKVNDWVNQKVANLHDFAQTANIHPDLLEKMNPADMQTFLLAAHEHGKAKGVPVPKTMYRDLTGDSLRMVLSRLRGGL